MKIKCLSKKYLRKIFKLVKPVVLGHMLANPFLARR